MSNPVYQAIKTAVDTAVKKQVQSPALASELFEKHKAAAVKALLSGKGLLLSNGSVAQQASPITPAHTAWSECRQILTQVGANVESYLLSLPASVWDAVQFSAVDLNEHIVALTYTSPDTLTIELDPEQMDGVMKSPTPGSLETAALLLLDDHVVWSHKDPYTATTPSARTSWVVALNLSAMLKDMAEGIHVVEKSTAVLPGFWAAAQMSKAPGSILSILRVGGGTAFVDKDTLVEIQEWGQELPEWERKPLTIRKLQKSDCLLPEKGVES